MCIFIILRNQGAIERDNQLSKFNFGSRKTYAIEEVLLEKRIIYNTAVYIQLLSIHIVTDLEAYYNR